MLIIIALPAIIEIYTSSIEAKIQSIGITSLIIIPFIVIAAILLLYNIMCVLSGGRYVRRRSKTQARPEKG